MPLLRPILTCILIIQSINIISGFLLTVLDDRPQREGSMLQTNKVSLVKRIVPRHHKTPPFEYDRKHKTVFVPKYRVHKRKPIHNEKIYTELYKMLFEPVHSRKPAILKLVGFDDGNVLRANPLEDMAGVYDPVGPKSKGRPEQVEDADADFKKKPQFNFPHFSLYNYWTYDKALFHDLCPPGLAKVGHKCIFAPMAA